MGGTDTDAAVVARPAPWRAPGGRLAANLMAERERWPLLAARIHRRRHRVRLRHGDGGLAPGDGVRLRVSLEPPPAPAMPGAYDFQRRA